MIIDAQVHVWKPGLEEHAAKVLHRAMGPAEVLAQMDAEGVNRAVIVPPGKDSNEFSVELATTHPDRFRVMKVLPLNRATAREEVAAWDERPPVVAGVRLPMPPWRPSSWIQDGTADWFWPEAMTHGIPVMIWAPGKYESVAEIAARHPGLRIIIDHLGMYVDVRDDAIMAAISPVLALAELPNVGVKRSALPCYTTQPFPFSNLHEPIKRAYDAFGPERLFWGTDMSRLTCTYHEALALFTEELTFLSDDDRSQIMGGALARWLNWE
jgi:L-fuconolactonase